MEQVFTSHLQDNRLLIYSIINYYCSDPYSRDDLFQDIALNAWLAYPKFSGKGKASSWLAAIARYTAIRRLRKLRTRIQTTAMNNWLYEIADEPVERAESIDHNITSFIETLSSVERRTLQYRAEGRTFAEISELTGEPIGRLLVRMHRLKKDYLKNIKICLTNF